MSAMIIFLFIYGLCIGSFVNMLIYRLPRETLFSEKWSFCDHCQKKLSLRDLIPLVSFMLSKGKSRCCQKKLPRRYCAIELTCALAPILFFLYYPEKGHLPMFLMLPWVIGLLIAHIVIDLEHFLLFDLISGVLFFLFLGLFWRKMTFPDFVIAPLLAYGVPWLVNAIFMAIKKKDGMGMGDFKLFAVFAPFLGVQESLTLLFLSCLLGSVLGGGYLYFIKKDLHAPLPFGPFIIVVGFAQLFLNLKISFL
jgi:leader peptidase (prepilin peptidase) / N-methyltransferase